ncbi:DotG/IcmE/VirB10 family protein [Beijerinckia mobilis]|uniref:DotG/IcmE/VirB10 family protein n=1 Tax=Beijerinckia mobilis TaxID=231434 RepID=UPI000691592D|nr:DotG/IcmE/VirB10 family protein [Beijerinckia mobilis]
MVDFSASLSKFLPHKPAFFNAGGKGGPRRLLVIAGTGVSMIALVSVLSMQGQKDPLISKVTKPPAINPNPGGLQSDPAQEKLRMVTASEQAKKASEVGYSFTPVMAGSQRTKPLIMPEFLEAPEPPKPFVGTPTIAPVPPPKRVASLNPAVESEAPPQAMIHKVAQRSQEEDKAYQMAIAQMLRSWEGRPPRTDIVLPPEDKVVGKSEAEPRGSRAEPASGLAARSKTNRSSAILEQKAKETVLIPAGRMIYAHTVTAADSDSNGPIVLQADSGPLAGDRMIGSFSKSKSTRLVIQVQRIEHNGQELKADGLVVAPDTMETTVASDIDQHYMERVILPGAAAFVEGVGQAIAMSNTTSQVSPLGGVTAFTKLNFQQQLGVGAGAAANRLGSTLTQQMPTGPTVKLGANLPIGVMFVSPVKMKTVTDQASSFAQ